MRSMRSRGWDPAISPSGRARLDNLCQLSCPNFEFIQLLGTQDDTVSPDDMLDNDVEMENVNYFIVEVQNSTHAKIIEMERPPTDDRAIDQGKPEYQRYTQFKFALLTDRYELRSKAVDWEDVSDAMPDEPEWGVKEVVFVIHGIRDKGFWTQKIARRIKQLARTNMQGPTPVSALEYRSVTASYGYFAMAPFVFPPVRIRKVAWLMDQYTEARVRYPNARFSYVGHSNGTYLVARALKDYPAARFNRIVFAGSVVRSDYDWAAIAKPPAAELCQARRVEKVLNYVATRDWVVAAFPKAMQLYRWTDLGGAGHDGFKTAVQLCQAPSVDAAVDALQNERLLQLEYVEGRHDAAIRETHWGDIASFVVHGTLPWLTKTTAERYGPPAAPSSFKKGQPNWSRVLGKLSVVLLPALVMLVLGLGGWLLWRIFLVPPCPPNVQAAACVSQITSEVVTRVGFLLAYLTIVFVITTRF
jgi:pimeloyl-ACP methyl ester carboxylesterase